MVNFHHTKNHNSTAFELFFNSGPLAVLPMKKILKNSFSSSLIYSHDSKTIDSLFAIQKNLLHLVLEEKIKNYVGNIKQIIDIQKFELSAHINKSFSEQNLIYLGDSAHSIHPIAGQGWNIGVRDIEKFINILKKNISFGLDINSTYLTDNYHHLTYYDAYSLFLITDKLNTMFKKDDFVSNIFRKTGFGIINKNNLIKKYITNYAMGFDV